MELDLSRERAELSRERQRLERLREEARQDLERLQRDAGVRERLAPVQRLREEMADKQQGAAGGNDEALKNRLRGLRGKLSDAPA
jgi:hypothetical protein